MRCDQQKQDQNEMNDRKEMIEAWIIEGADCGEMNEIVQSRISWPLE